jgi:hypothetical protein
MRHEKGRISEGRQPNYGNKPHRYVQRTWKMLLETKSKFDLSLYDPKQDGSARLGQSCQSKRRVFTLEEVPAGI